MSATRCIQEYFTEPRGRHHYSYGGLEPDVKSPRKKTKTIRQFAARPSYEFFKRHIEADLGEIFHVLNSLWLSHESNMEKVKNENLFRSYL